MISGVHTYAFWCEDKEKVLFRITEDLVIDLLNGNKLFIYKEENYTTDFASIPWWFRWAIPTTGKHSIAALAHDYLYDKRVGTRKQADKIFLNIMIQYQVNVIVAHMMYFGVRLGGKKWWRDE
jgi:hypothetical protein